MKVTLEVAEGVHKGKKIPVAGPQFLIGRDPHCQLRPASPSISKQHCAILLTETGVVVKDFGSTNGTFINGEAVQGEMPVNEGENLKVGPLSFTVHVAGAPKPAPAPAAEAPDPDADVEVGREENDGKNGPGSDRMAALLLGLEDDDDDNPRPVSESDVPDGDTVFDMPAVDAEKKKAEEEAAKKAAEDKDNSKIAGDILKQWNTRRGT